MRQKRQTLRQRFLSWTIIGLCLVALGCNAATADSSTSEGQMLPITAEVELGSEQFQLEVARTPSEQAMGLMYRPSLEDNRGMLFPFRYQRVVQFWMKNCLIPLDMVFLRNGTVQAVVTAPPCEDEPCPTYGPSTAVDSVIELRGGRAQEVGITPGDRVEIRFLEGSQS
ncbi:MULTISPECIES: DUF192 domain-containing protein [unclassified Leptolyngbya]|uniref:DUF192 domain-containing protein n=1 Tax=unclassified Leptolyngbya TaxID=2650499 RepID=UPI0016827D0B|nr:MULTISPECIES: DUF192 domain-containing protein [unclassified Leptolyngbya]MBD1910966.1 DUF192 domain-containing protein [Leptolyngbya sp. FACHB-8]MBD2158367.1 DUF192 domain-containing protein [Leptolyngbya sp. FACHB-16]